jgi:hypothetical protein
VNRDVPAPLAGLFEVRRLVAARAARQHAERRRRVELAIRSVETALDVYDRTEPGRRDRERREFERLLSWVPPEP